MFDEMHRPTNNYFGFSKKTWKGKGFFIIHQRLHLCTELENEVHDVER